MVRNFQAKFVVLCSEKTFQIFDNRVSINNSSPLNPIYSSSGAERRVCFFLLLLSLIDSAQQRQ